MLLKKRLLLQSDSRNFYEKPSFFLFFYISWKLDALFSRSKIRWFFLVLKSSQTELLGLLPQPTLNHDGHQHSWRLSQRESVRSFVAWMSNGSAKVTHPLLYYYCVPPKIVQSIPQARQILRHLSQKNFRLTSIPDTVLCCQEETLDKKIPPPKK